MQISVIPDIHADPDRLDRSLAAAGPGRLAFLGDLIDAGKGVARPDDAAVLARVRDLCAEGRAQVVMGNHELNAILFHRLGVDGVPLRDRGAKNRAQHDSFCAAFGVGTDRALDWTRWFLTLPLWLDLGGVRLVHACWSDPAIACIAARRPDGRLTEADLPEVAAKQSLFAKAVLLLVTGPEVPLPKGAGFHDKGGHWRDQVRIAWWRPKARTWRGAALSVPDALELPEGQVATLPGFDFYPADAPPVLVGHYKMTGSPGIEAANAACLDYPDAPCLYRWQGETRLRQSQLIRL